MADIEYQISLTLGDHIEDYDIPAIATEIRSKGVSNIDDIGGLEYWEIVRSHEKPTRPQSGDGWRDQ